MAAARCRGLLASETTFETEFVRGLDVMRADADPFEAARTQLCFGERLRRARRRVEARGHLSVALETFECVGAMPWAARAERELHATSVTARRRNDPTILDELTPREDDVVSLLAQGATVREAAARMYVSPKTIEAHLGRAYRKLGVHNRAQLALALASLEGRDVRNRTI